MTAKTPTLSSFFNISTKVRKDPNDVVSNALDLFEKAQVKLNEAEQELLTQVADDQAEIERLELTKALSNSALDKLSRVKARLSDLLA